MVERFASAICEYEICLLPPAILLLVTRPNALGLVTGLILFFWVARTKTTGHAIRYSSLNLPLLVLLGAVAYSVTKSLQPWRTLEFLSYLLAGVFTFLVIINWANCERRLRLVAGGFLAGGALLALAAPITVEWMPATKLTALYFEDIYAHFRLLIADPIHPNVMAGALAPILPLCISMLVFGHGPVRLAGRSAWLGRMVGQLLPALACLLILVVLVLTKSRGACLGLAFGIGIVLMGRWPPLRLPGLGLGALLLAGGGYVLLNRITPGDLLAKGSALSGLDWRFAVWMHVLQALHDSPVSGLGLGNFQTIMETRYAFMVDGAAESIPHAHNLYLQVAADLGLPGLVAYLALLLTAVGLNIRMVMRRQQPWLSLGLLGSLTVLMVHGLVDAAQWNTKPSFLSWAVLGLTAALYNLETGKREEEGRYGPGHIERHDS